MRAPTALARPRLVDSGLSGGSSSTSKQLLPKVEICTARTSDSSQHRSPLIPILSSISSLLEVAKTFRALHQLWQWCQDRLLNSLSVASYPAHLLLCHMQAWRSPRRKRKSAILEADCAYAAPVKPYSLMRPKLMKILATNMPIVTRVGPHIRF